MTILTTDNQTLALLRIGKLVPYTDEQGEEDYRAEPSSLLLCRDGEGKVVELELTAVRCFCKPYAFLNDDTTTETESEQDNPLSATWTLDSLLSYCSTKTGVSAEELCTRTKNRTVTAVRGLFCYLACRLTSSTLTNIGEKVGLAHNMVGYYRDTVQGYVESGDKRTKELLERLKLNFDDSKMRLDRLNK